MNVVLIMRAVSDSMERERRVRPQAELGKGRHTERAERGFI